MSGDRVIPAALLSKGGARLAIAAKAASPLAGGPNAFSAYLLAAPGERRFHLLRDRPLSADLQRSLSAPRPSWAGFTFERPLIMGVVNVTPDSFSDGGDFADVDAAIQHGRRLAAEGADILDIGGESTRPGAESVSPREEGRRIIPVIEALAREGHVVSIDSRHAVVMAAALRAGARIINDITALTGDPRSIDVAAESQAPLILMHMQGEPRSMQAAPVYRDVTLDLLDYFDARLAALAERGIPASRVVLDPGIGFGKTDRHNLQLLSELAAFQGFGVPVALGVSRKGFIGRLSRQEPPKERGPGSLALATLAFSQGVQIVRVHDVAATVQAWALWLAVNG